MQPNLKCRFGVNCIYLKQNNCRYSHPNKENFQSDVKRQNTSGRKPCINGADCRFMKKGTCHFYHPSQHQPNSHLLNSQGNKTSSFGIPKQLKQNSFESIENTFQKSKKLKYKEKEGKQLQQQMLVNRQKERQSHVQTQNQLQTVNKIKRQQKQRRPHSQNFDWYFGKICHSKIFETLKKDSIHWINVPSALQALQWRILRSLNLKEKKRIIKGSKRNRLNPISYKIGAFKRGQLKFQCKHKFNRTYKKKKWKPKNVQCAVCTRIFQKDINKKKWEYKKMRKKEQEKKEVSYGEQKSMQSIFERLWRYQLVKSDKNQNSQFQEFDDNDYDDDGYQEQDREEDEDL